MNVNVPVNSTDKIVLILLAVLAAVQAAGLIPLGLALRDRLKEIKGGELYEARQY